MAHCIAAELALNHLQPHASWMWGLVAAVHEKVMTPDSWGLMRQRGPVGWEERLQLYLRDVVTTRAFLVCCSF